MSTTASARPATTARPAAKKKAAPKKDLSSGYNKFKEFNGKLYTGVQIGRGHYWNYDKGDWKETKITPDLWEISYAVTKRRVGKAPETSGVPVGTEYHWYILAHQTAKKLNANNYETTMTGLKFKLAHKRADKGKWSASGDLPFTGLLSVPRQSPTAPQYIEHPRPSTPQFQLRLSEAPSRLFSPFASLCRSL